MTHSTPRPDGDAWVGDAAIARLRALEDHPDFSGTRYEIADPIGRGGMGVVFRGRDRELDREVAIKVTTLSTAGEADRLRSEARTLARLEHPGIVGIHDVGRLPDGRVFTVMMLVRGERLDACAARLPLADRLRLFDRICDAVSFAHERGVLHRDLTPANIMVGAHGQVLVLDWGLACMGSDAGPADRSVVPAGTVGYIAPESRTQIADARADVFALGVILRGLLPTSGARSVRPLDSVVRKAMKEDPLDRYQTAGELAADVRRFVDGAPVAAHAESLVERGARLARAYRTPIGLVLAYLAMRGLLLFWP